MMHFFRLRNSVRVFTVKAEGCLGEGSTIRALQQLVAKIEQSKSHQRPRSSIQTSLRALASKVCVQYPALPSIIWKSSMDDPNRVCERHSFLKFLALDTSRDQNLIADAVESYQKKATDPDLRPIHLALRLQEVSTPKYEEIIRCLLQQNATESMRFLLDLRRDILLWMPYLRTHPPPKEVDSQGDLLIHLKQLDTFLRRLLSTWFSPGLLEVQRITYDGTPASIIEQIVRQEAVHPVKNLDDLRTRFGPDRRVYALFHVLLPERPLVVLHTSLQPEIPAYMNQVYNEGSLRSDARVAAFYSISNLQAGLSGVGLGEHLIKTAVHRLQGRIGLDTFVTLSPVPRFRKWLEERVQHVTGKFASNDLVVGEDLAKLSHFLQCREDEAVSRMVETLRQEGPSCLDDNAVEVENLVAPLLRGILAKLAARYLVTETHRRKPLDGVARFHVGNGAILHRINVNADTSRKGWHNSFGIMVNYRYDLEQLPTNVTQYEAEYRIPLGEDVQALLDESLPPSFA
jgi:hypothetical protein